MFGLNATTAANASLLNNFEIVATAIIALMIFKEKNQSAIVVRYIVYNGFMRNFVI